MNLTKHNKKRARLLIKIDNESFPLREVCDAIGIKYSVAYQRIRISEWPIERALNFITDEELLNRIYENRENKFSSKDISHQQWIQEKRLIEAKNKELEDNRPVKRLRSKALDSIDARLKSNGEIEIKSCNGGMVCLTVDEIISLHDFAVPYNDTKIDNPLEQCLFSGEISGADFKILYYLYKNATNKKINCCKAEVARKTNCGERSVYRSINALIKTGIINENNGTYEILI